jgi:hypothetical protein
VRGTAAKSLMRPCLGATPRSAGAPAASASAVNVLVLMPLFRSVAVEGKGLRHPSCARWARTTRVLSCGSLPQRDRLPSRVSADRANACRSEHTQELASHRPDARGVAREIFPQAPVFSTVG